MPSRRVPPDQRKRTEISCDRCKHRKQKCHKPPEKAACRYCETHGFECLTSQRPKTRIFSSLEGVTARIGLLEGIVRGLVPDADTSSLDSMRALGTSLGIPLPPPSPGTRSPLATDRPETISAGTGASSEPQASQADQQPDEMPVLRDQQGQTQYVGPASSFLFQIRIRSLFGGPRQRGQSSDTLFLFGRNPTEKAWVNEVASFSAEMTPSPSIHAGSTPASDITTGTPIDAIIASPVPDALITAFFENVHPDFPVLHEASFREEYERQAQSPGLLASTADPTWIGSLLCVLILARRSTVVDLLSPHGQEAEDRWWRKVQALLPSILFTSSISAVQTLLLIALHLHNTNHRDSCWTLTGAAVRIAFAIGLHRDAIIGNNKKPLHTPITRELRKRLWWTLYSFEMMQASSLDRPSAIDETVCSAGCPRESILGTGFGSGDAGVLASSRLVVMLSQACRAVRSLTSDPAGCFSVRPQSPAASLLADLNQWSEQLPSHLRLDATDALPPSSQRAVLLMHCQYHYIFIILSRNALLAIAAKHSASDVPGAAKTSEPVLPLPRPASATHTTSPVLSDMCIQSAQETIKVMLRLDAILKFDPVSWFDMYYLYSASLVLVLSVICEVRRFHTFEAAQRQSEWIGESLRLLAASSDLAAKQLSNPSMPGTMHRYAIVISDLHSMTHDFVMGQPPRSKDPAILGAKPEPGPDAVMLITSPVPPPMDQQQAYLFSAAAAEMDPGRSQHGDMVFAQDGYMAHGGAAFGYGFGQGMWTWDGQWNDVPGMLLGSQYGQPHQ